MKVNLFEDQEEFVYKLRRSVQAGNKSILGVASPAFGKTIVAAYITHSANEKTGASVWFLVHRKNLLRQTSQSFWANHIEHGLITSGKRRSTQAIQVGTIGTAYSRMATLTPPKILFIDEAHLAKGNMFESVITWARESGSLVIGLTGTPERLDGKALGDVFEDLIEARSTSWLMEQGRLSSYDIYTTPLMPDLSEVKRAGGDYNREQLEQAMDKGDLLGDAVSHWRKLANGMITVVYCVSVKHSKHTAEAFNNAGIPAVHVDAKTTEAELKEACLGLASGKYKILCNCELVIEGFDLSAQVGQNITIECCMLLRPTQSLARYLQMVFRALRAKPKPAIILDHAGCVLKHGLPDDERSWTLEGKKKGKRKADDEEPDIHIHQCKSCFHIFKAGVSECPKCGEPVEVRKRAELKVVDGDLVKVDMEAIKRERKQQQGKARDLSDLVKVGYSRGMNKPAAWAANVFAARSGRKANKTDYDEANQALKALRASA